MNNSIYNVCTVCEELNPVCLEYLTFTLLDDGTYSVKANGKTKIPATLYIPNKYNGKTVTKLDKDAFKDVDVLTSVVIPDSVTSIGSFAFYYCDSLKTVYYKGTAKEWSKISIDSSNTDLTSATRYYYSEAQPTDTTYNYWHYDENGNPVKW